MGLHLYFVSFVILAQIMLNTALTLSLERP